MWNGHKKQDRKSIESTKTKTVAIIRKRTAKCTSVLYINNKLSYFPKAQPLSQATNTSSSEVLAR